MSNNGNQDSEKWYNAPQYKGNFTEEDKKWLQDEQVLEGYKETKPFWQWAQEQPAVVGGAGLTVCVLVAGLASCVMKVNPQTQNRIMQARVASQFGTLMMATFGAGYFSLADKGDTPEDTPED